MTEQTISPRQRERLFANWNDVRRRIREAETRSNRTTGSCRLLAVVKRVPDEVVRLLFEFGQREVAENRVQAFEARPPALRDQGEWTLIGHLQTNKARRARELFAAFHGLDSIRLAEKLATAKMADPWPVFLQVNVSDEPQKFGCAPDEAGALARTVGSMTSLQIRGLMGMAPYSDDEDPVRRCFQRLRNLSENLRQDGDLPANASELSMGMSQDFEIAVEEGATVVRVGSTLFEGVLT